MEIVVADCNKLINVWHQHQNLELSALQVRKTSEKQKAFPSRVRKNKKQKHKLKFIIISWTVELFMTVKTAFFK